MNSKSAWEKFQATGTILDYLNYRNIENGLLPCLDVDNKSDSRGINNEIGCNGNNNKRNGFK